MILTVTCNPAVDVTYQVDRLAVGEVHRVATVHERPGGKGVNVARVLHALGHDVVVTGLAGGGTGTDIRRDLARTIISSGWGLTELRPMRMSLEEIFLSLTTDEAEAAAAPAGGETPNA